MAALTMVFVLHIHYYKCIIMAAWRDFRITKGLALVAPELHVWCGCVLILFFWYFTSVGVCLFLGRMRKLEIVKGILFPHMQPFLIQYDTMHVINSPSLTVRPSLRGVGLVHMTLSVF